MKMAAQGAAQRGQVYSGSSAYTGPGWSCEEIMNTVHLKVPGAGSISGDWTPVLMILRFFKASPFHTQVPSQNYLYMFRRHGIIISIFFKHHNDL